MSSNKVPIKDKWRGWNKNSPIYDSGFVIAKPDSKNLSPSTKDESSAAPSDPMQPAIDSIEEFLKERCGDQYNPKQ